MTRERVTAISGRPMRWLDAGLAESPHVLVWLHAFPLSAEMWRPQLERPPDGWRVIAPDLAGFGGSADHVGQPGIDDFAQDLDELIDAAGIRNFVLGGLSMGGYAAFAYLRHKPARVRGIVLADTKSGADTPAARDGRQKMLDLVAARGVAGVADEMVPKLLGGSTQRANKDLVLRVRRLIEANTADGVSRAIQRLRDRPDSSPMLPRLTVPALIVVGEEDGITPVADARAMANAIADATLTIVSRAGHLTNLENADAFDAALKSWLATI